MTDHELDKVVKIAGTDYDRRRKLKDADIQAIRRLVSKGHSMKSVADTYGVSYNTVHYHVSSAFKQEVNKNRGFYAPSFLDSKAQRISRVAYKRSILNKI